MFHAEKYLKLQLRNHSGNVECKKLDHGKTLHNRRWNVPTRDCHLRCKLIEMDWNWILSVRSPYCLLLRMWKTKKNQHRFHGPERYNKDSTWYNAVNAQMISIRFGIYWLSKFMPQSLMQKKRWLMNFMVKFKLESNRTYASKMSPCGRRDWNPKLEIVRRKNRTI